jgi:hypothetical protein
MARLPEFHQLLGLVVHSLDMPNQHISSVLVGSCQLTAKQRCSKREAFFFGEFLHPGHMENPCFCRNALKLHGRDSCERIYRCDLLSQPVQMNNKGSNSLDRKLPRLALEAIPRATPLSGTFFEKSIDVRASNRVCCLINRTVVASIYRDAGCPSCAK